MERKSALGGGIRPGSATIQWSAGILLFAFVMRILSLNFIQPYGLGLDENVYISNALKYASGEAFTNQFFMPGWPWILSWFARFDSSVYFLRHCAIVFGSLSVLLVYLFGRRIFNENTGRLAALLLAVYPDHLLFSNFVQAEAALETFTIAATAFAFWHRPSRDRLGRDSISAAAFGAIILIKHFSVISFAAFLSSRAYRHRRFLKLIAISVAFIVPVFLHGAYMGMTGRDPLVIVNSPLKSAGEWGPAAIRSANFTPGVNRLEKLRQHVEWIVDRPFEETKNSIRKNLFQLWSPGTFGIRRMLTNFYSISPGVWFSWIHAAFYFSVIVLGIFGLAFGAPSLFRRYTILTITYLSIMSVAWYMVTRYRHPFEFLFFLFAADVVVQFGAYKNEFLKGSKARWAGWIAATVFFLIVFIARVPHMASYQ